MSIKLDDIVQDHEKRINKIEIDGARLDGRLDALVSSTNNLKVGLWIFSTIMLLTMVYQILGKEGYKDVTSTVTPIVQQVKK